MGKRAGLVEEALTRSVVGAFYKVYNTLGYGFLEHVYSLALERELIARGHRVAREVSVVIWYNNEPLTTQRVDMLVDEKLVVENKSTAVLHPFAARQLYNYLRATDLEVGLLLHYGPEPKPHIEPAPPTPQRGRARGGRNAATLVRHPRLRRLVERQLRADWSPQQIAAWLVSSFPDEPAMHVSRETIYRSLYVQARGALKRALIAHLRRQHAYRRLRAAAQATRGSGQLVDIVPIAQRPASADARADTGKATSSSGSVVRRLRPSSNVTRALCCSCGCPPPIRRASSTLSPAGSGACRPPFVSR